MADRHEIIGFFKYNDSIGLYRADHEAWLLDVGAYCTARQIAPESLTKRKDGRFAGKEMMRPARRSEINALRAWFDANAKVDASKLEKQLATMPYGKLDEEYEHHLPVVLYDFDELVAYENPDLNPATPYDDFLPEGWKSIVVEGFDALVPDEYVYWAKAGRRLNTLRAPITGGQ